MNQGELEFRNSPQPRSQNEKLRAYFEAHPGVWLDLPALARVITPTGIGAAVHSRVNDCRLKFGMPIENHVSRREGQSVSRYRYVPGPAPTQN